MRTIIVFITENVGYKGVIAFFVALCIIFAICGNRDNSVKEEPYSYPAVADIVDVPQKESAWNDACSYYFFRTEPDEKIYDASGNAYEGSGVYIIAYNYDSSPSSTITYSNPHAQYGLKTNGHYNYLSGTFFMRSNSPYMEEDEYYDVSMRVRVWAENKLVYSKEGITPYTEPVQFDIELNQCDWLWIQVSASECSDNLGRGDWPQIVFANTTLH